MTCSIRITSPTTTDTWTKLGSSDDYEDIRNLMDTPVPITNERICSRDFFLPITTHYALRVENIALRVLAALSSVILDILTLPFRLIGHFSQMCSNISQEEHPLQAYLVVQGAPRGILESSHINIDAFCLTGHSYTCRGELLLDYETKNFSSPFNFANTRVNERVCTIESQFGASRVRATVLPSILSRRGLTSPKEIAHFTLHPKS